MHGVQYRIVRRGAELLDIGGRLVYSTCSLNPLENEAVLHRIIRDSEGALELLDISDMLPGLKYAKGIASWKVTDKECQNFYRSFDEVPEELRTVIRPQMFPPQNEDASKYFLDKCIRILPHFQNTGGFFVAALTKKSKLPWERADGTSNENTNIVEENQQASREPQRKRRRFFGFKEDPFVFFGENEEIWRDIKSFYDISETNSDSFKSTQLLTRSLTGKKKNIYFCSDSVKEFVQKNEENVKIINLGVKVFSRCDHRNMSCEFRMANEGLDSVQRVIGDRRKIEVTREDLIRLLESTDPKSPPSFHSMSEKVKSQMHEFESGSCMLLYRDDSGMEIFVVGWKGINSLRAYIDVNDSIHNLRLLGVDVSSFEVNKFNKNIE